MLRIKFLFATQSLGEKTIFQGSLISPFTSHKDDNKTDTKDGENAEHIKQHGKGIGFIHAWCFSTFFIAVFTNFIIHGIPFSLSLLCTGKFFSPLLLSNDCSLESL
jgi:hypothetical protein